MEFKKHLKSPLGITFSAIGLVAIAIWSINGFFSWRTYAKFAYEAQQIQPMNLVELLMIKDESNKIATFTKTINCNLVEIEMRNENKYLLKYGGGSMTDVMDSVGRNGGKGIYKEPNTLLGLPLCFSPTSLQYKIYKSMRDGETAPNQNENNKNNQDNNTNNNSKQETFSFPNPFQRNISKSINVLESITNNSGMAYITEWMTPNCKSISINRQRFDELLSSGVKVITANEWRTPIPKLNTGGHEYQFVANQNAYDDKCVGQTYILEGPENLLNKL
jgi:hypothetical protein